MFKITVILNSLCFSQPIQNSIICFHFQLLGFILVSVCAINIADKQRSIDRSPTARGVVTFLLILGLCLMVAAVIGCICALREQVKVLYVVSVRITFFDRF